MFWNGEQFLLLVDDVTHPGWDWARNYPHFTPMRAIAACTSREAMDAAERLLIPRVCNLEVSP